MGMWGKHRAVVTRVRHGEGTWGRRKDRDGGDTAGGHSDHQGHGSDRDGVTTCVTGPQPLPMSPSPPSMSLFLPHLSLLPGDGDIRPAVTPVSPR